MFLLIAVLAIASAALLFARYFRRQTDQIPRHNRVLSQPPINARPLFAPSEAQIRREIKAQDTIDAALRDVDLKAGSQSRVETAFANWTAEPNRSNAVELLRVTAEDGSGTDFVRSAEEILKVYREFGIARLDDSDMATLLESHIRLVAGRDTGSGELFWLKQEVTRLRSGK